MSPSTRPQVEDDYSYSKQTLRQILSFSFYKVMPEWRRLSRSERDDHRHEAADVLHRWCLPGELRMLTYSTVGMRADCDMMLWRICYSLECLQKMSTDFLGTRLGGYLQPAHSFLGMTKRSHYQISGTKTGSGDANIHPGSCQYLFVYPYVKSRAWYQIPWEERQRIVTEYIRAVEQASRVRLHTTYSYGLDDQEFVIAYETNHPEDFLDLVMKLRETENSTYIVRDTPMFTCLQVSLEEMLERLG
jgi:chlorite dismutase